MALGVASSSPMTYGRRGMTTTESRRPDQPRSKKGNTLGLVRAVANQAFSRAAGAQLVGGNRVRLLKNAAENYPAWLEAIASAQRCIHFENYIVHDDEIGSDFANALARKAQEGVAVRVMYDWLGCFGTPRAFWSRMRAAGVDVRCYNPPKLSSPVGWLSRDHRKMLAVDGRVGFISGLCVGQMWAGYPERNIAPWRDTGVEIHGPVVAEIDRAFAFIWEMVGPPLPDDELTPESAPATREGSEAPPEPAGDMDLRIVASVPSMGGLFRLDQLIAGLARERLWLTDAYYAGTTSYVQALCAAAKDGVDVRLLVPGASDIPLIKPLTRAGYRTLLQAGVRVFEWNGTMIHAKTAVADGRWARVGSTNLNMASWMGNCELDAVVEDASFAQQMEEMYLEDLSNATEVVLDARRRISPPARQDRRIIGRGRRGSVGRATAGALRIGNAVGAAFTRQRVLEPVEARIMFLVAVLLLGLATLFILYPRVLVIPLVVIMVWVAGALLWTGLGLLREPTDRSDDAG